MIFVTVGVQLPFDRLVRAVDEWAGKNGRRDIEVQTGNSSYVCQNVKAQSYLRPAEFLALVQEAELVVAHAGMGSIITALELGKPIIVMPRQASLREHRNDHQLSTARHLSKHGLIEVAQDVDELFRLLDKRRDGTLARSISTDASGELIDGLKTIIWEEPRRSALSRMFSTRRGPQT